VATFPPLLAGRSDQRFYEMLVLATLDLIFTPHRAGSVRVFFKIYEAPGPLGFGVFGSALIVTLNTGIQVLGRSHVIAAVLFTLQDVDVEWHVKTGSEACHAAIKKGLANANPF